MASGVHATFMPKPIEGVQGSGMHTHLSLWNADANAFHDPDAADGLSDVARSFIAGVLVHAPELTAVTNQLVNSYKRLVAGFEAPVNISWAHNDRSALVRVPVPKRGKESQGTRIEYRALDPACNPYLAFSVLLAAGLRGIAEGYELGPESTAVLTDEADRPGHHWVCCRPTCPRPSTRWSAPSCVRSALGEHIFEWFLRNKRAEWGDVPHPRLELRARPLPAGLVSRCNPLLIWPEPATARPGARPRSLRHRLGGRRR